MGKVAWGFTSSIDGFIAGCSLGQRGQVHHWSSGT